MQFSNRSEVIENEKEDEKREKKSKNSGDVTFIVGIFPESKLYIKI